MVDSSNVKMWLLDYFTQLMSNRAKSLVTQFGTPPLKYAAIVGQHPLEKAKAFETCMADWKTLLMVESAMAAGGKVPALNHCHWRLNALTRCVPQLHSVPISLDVFLYVFWSLGIAFSSHLFASC